MKGMKSCFCSISFPANVTPKHHSPVPSSSTTPPGKGFALSLMIPQGKTERPADAPRRSSPAARSNLAWQGSNLVKPWLQLRKDNIPGIFFLDQAPGLSYPGRRTVRIADHLTNRGGNLVVPI